MYKAYISASLTAYNVQNRKLPSQTLHDLYHFVRDHDKSLTTQVHDGTSSGFLSTNL